jgi:hypothetical protein
MNHRVLLAAALALSLAASARGHDPGLSEIELALGSGRVEASWWIDPADLAGSEPEAEGALLLEIDGTAAEVSFSDARATWDGHRRLRLVWSKAPREELRISAALLERLPLGHRVLVRILGADGRTRGEHLLSARAPRLVHRM